MTSRTRPSSPGPIPLRTDGRAVRERRIDRRVFLATGLVAALLLAAAPFVPVGEDTLTGAVLVGFALDWAMLAALSARFTASPQRWAVALALFIMARRNRARGPSAPRPVLYSTGCPPAMLALAIWMTSRMRRRLASRGDRLLLYPVQPAELVVVHIVLGVPLSIAWRRSRNLAGPAFAQAVNDAFRNALMLGL